jgi:hypothetical protein
MRFLLLFTLALLSFSPLAFAQNRCVDIFAPAPALTVQYGYTEEFRNEDFFGVEVPEHSYMFHGTLSSTGKLSLSAFLAFPEYGVRSHLRGADLYKQMIEYFGVSKIRSIEGHWVDETNFNQFFAGLKNGLSQEQAASATWSGRQAALYGFTKVESVEVRVQSVTGSKTVIVVFTRP